MKKAFFEFHHTWWGKIIIAFLTLVMSFIFAFLLFVRDIAKQMNTEESGYAAQYLQGPKYQVEKEGSYWLGSSNPKVSIVEFADFACPYCKNTYTLIREVSIRYKDKVKITYRDFPLHEESLDLAMGARCAGEQGLFWPMHDKLFTYQGIKDIAQIKEIANQVGADSQKWTKCIEEKKYLNEISEDLTEAERLGLSGTPTWFINGYKLEGDVPQKILFGIIDELTR